MQLVEIPSTNHMFAAASPRGTSEALAKIGAAVADWIEAQTPA
jgi:hypothetical protein